MRLNHSEHMLMIDTRIMVMMHIQENDHILPVDYLHEYLVIPYQQQSLPFGNHDMHHIASSTCNDDGVLTTKA
jgi:hypothetical protein